MDSEKQKQIEAMLFQLELKVLEVQRQLDKLRVTLNKKVTYGTSY